MNRLTCNPFCARSPKKHSAKFSEIGLKKPKPHQIKLFKQLTDEIVCGDPRDGLTPSIASSTGTM